MKISLFGAHFLGAMLAFGTTLNAQQIEGPYSYQNAGKLLYQTEFASVHQRANLWAPYLQNERTTP